jgi:hypothetical protein
MSANASWLIKAVADVSRRLTDTSDTPGILDRAAWMDWTHEEHVMPEME